MVYWVTEILLLSESAKVTLHLAHMMIIFQSTDYRVCDMIAVGLPAHTDLYDIVFTLYPFNNGFDSKTEGPFGLAVKHKISMY